MKAKTSSTINQAIDIICQTLPDVVGIYVFGSTGTTFEHKDSDIDLAILPTSKLSSTTRWELAQKIASAIGRDVDLIDLLQASTVFRFQIISTGRCVYRRDKSTCDFFEMFVYSSYLRFNDERREIINHIKKRGQVFNG